jgi:hypothetical protein
MYVQSTPAKVAIYKVDTPSKVDSTWNYIAGYGTKRKKTNTYSTLLLCTRSWKCWFSFIRSCTRIVVHYDCILQRLELKGSCKYSSGEMGFDRVHDVEHLFQKETTANLGLTGTHCECSQFEEKVKNDHQVSHG